MWTASVGRASFEEDALWLELAIPYQAKPCIVSEPLKLTYCGVERREVGTALRSDADAVAVLGREPLRRSHGRLLESCIRPETISGRSGALKENGAL